VDVELLREQTPGCRHRVHLNNAGAALMSTATLEAMRHHLDLEAEIGGYEAADAASRCSTTRRMPGTPPSTPSRSARATAS
jgi:hypothetical protein